LVEAAGLCRTSGSNKIGFLQLVDNVTTVARKKASQLCSRVQHSAEKRSEVHQIELGRIMQGEGSTHSTAVFIRCEQNLLKLLPSVRMPLLQSVIAVR
jgi:hypothetical protein